MAVGKLTLAEVVMLKRANEQVAQFSSRNGMRRYYERDGWRIRVVGEPDEQRQAAQGRRSGRRLVVDL